METDQEIVPISSLSLRADVSRKLKTEEDLKKLVQRSRGNIDDAESNSSDKV